MIKYAEINGYKNLGECGMFTHLYEWIEKDKETPLVIIVHAYECKPKVFKGYIFNEIEKFQDVPVIDGELSEVEKFVGEKIEQCSFTDFIKGTLLEEDYGKYSCM